MSQLDIQTTEHKTDVLSRVRTRIQERGMSEKLAAKEIGLSPAALNQIFSGKYGADPKTQLEKMERWLDAQAEAQAAPQLPAAPDFVETATANKIIATLGYAQMWGDIAVIYGGAGVGKTTASKQYQERYPNVWVATMSPSSSSVASSLAKIAKAVGIKGVPHSATKLHDEITRKINGTGGLIVVDEAQHLSVTALDELRSLHDETGIGIALVGNESVYTRMTGGNRTAPYLDRLFSRIGKKIKLTRPTKGDVDRIASAFGVADSAALNQLAQIGSKAGALRAVVKTVRLATMMAAGLTPDAKHIQKAWEDLGV